MSIRCYNVCVLFQHKVGKKFSEIVVKLVQELERLKFKESQKIILCCKTQLSSLFNTTKILLVAGEL